MSYSNENQAFEPARKRVQCELHEEHEDRDSYVCNLKWPDLQSLRMDRFPRGLVLHLQAGEAWGSGEVDTKLASILINDVEVSSDRILYHFVQNGPREWPDFLWQTLCLAGLLDYAVDFQWEARFGFVTFPIAEEYVAKLAECARREGFSVTDSSDSVVDVTMEKKPTKTDGSVFDCVVDEFKTVNREALAFLAQKTVLWDHGTEEKVRFPLTLSSRAEYEGDGEGNIGFGPF